MMTQYFPLIRQISLGLVLWKLCTFVLSYQYYYLWIMINKQIFITVFKCVSVVCSTCRYIWFMKKFGWYVIHCMRFESLSFRVMTWQHYLPPPPQKKKWWHFKGKFWIVQINMYLEGNYTCWRPRAVTGPILSPKICRIIVLYIYNVQYIVA